MVREFRSIDTSLLPLTPVIYVSTNYVRTYMHTYVHMYYLTYVDVIESLLKLHDRSTNKITSVLINIRLNILLHGDRIYRYEKFNPASRTSNSQRRPLIINRIRPINSRLDCSGNLKCRKCLATVADLDLNLTSRSRSCFSLFLRYVGSETTLRNLNEVTCGLLILSR